MADIICADVLEWAASYQGEPFHSILCDPPYHLGKNGFMGKKWDAETYGIAFRPETWAALVQHLYPGAFIMAFGGSRTYHRLACAVEDAGFVLHSMIGHIQAQGFPKATRIDTQVDRNAGAEREVVGTAIGMGKQNPEWNGTAAGRKENSLRPEYDFTLPSTDLARTWQGHRYGLQSLKPCLEPVCVAQKPYEGRPVDDITESGAGALWIDGGRVRTSEYLGRPKGQEVNCYNRSQYKEKMLGQITSEPSGRWPPNFCLSHLPSCRQIGEKKVQGDNRTAPSGIGSGDIWAESTGHPAEAVYPDETIPEWDCAPGCPVAALNEQGGWSGSNWRPNKANGSTSIWGSGNYKKTTCVDDSGYVSRFYPTFDYVLDRIEMPAYYCPKAGKRERNAGVDMSAERTVGHNRFDKCSVCGGYILQNPDRPSACQCENPVREHNKVKGNPHPTVKPLTLAKWLATLLSPPSEYAPRRLLIPFGGVGSEAIGAILSGGWEHITLVEMDKSYCEIAEARIAFWSSWVERGYDDPKAILKAAKKDNGQARLL